MVINQHKVNLKINHRSETVKKHKKFNKNKNNLKIHKKSLLIKKIKKNETKIKNK